MKNVIKWKTKSKLYSTIIKSERKSNFTNPGSMEREIRMKGKLTKEQFIKNAP